MEPSEQDPASVLRVNSTDVNCHPVSTEDGQMMISLPGFADDTAIVKPSDNCDPNTEVEWSVQMDKSFDLAVHNQNVTNETDAGIIAADNLELEESYMKPDKQEVSGTPDSNIADTLERKEEESAENMKTPKIQDDVNMQLKHNVEDAEQKQALAKLRECQTYDDDEDISQFEEYDTSGYDEAWKKYEYFWKGSCIYSQWHRSEFYVDQQRFSSAEQYMMFQKAVLFQNDNIARKILYCNDPRKIKSLGREVRGFVPNIWDQHCLQIVKRGNIAKFSQNEEFKNEIVSTYPKVLVEASPYDRIWGIGLYEDDPLAWDETTWDGKNYLGYVLTEVRDDIMIDAGLLKETDRTRYIDKLLEEAGLRVDVKFPISRDNDSNVYTQAAASGIADTHSEKRYPRGETAAKRMKITPDRNEIKENVRGQMQSDNQLKQVANKSGIGGNNENNMEKYMYFWKGSVFSQWYKSNFDVDGKTFCCAEQFMMYKKAVLFDDSCVAEKILRSRNPNKMKDMGRNVHGFDEETWRYHCLNFVKEGNIAKFTQNDNLLKELSKTYPKIIVEASPYDKIWGIGLEEKDPRAWQEDTWQGMNYLGYVLTEVRDDLMTANGTIKDEGRTKYIVKLQEGMSSSVDRSPHDSRQDRSPHDSRQDRSPHNSRQDRSPHDSRQDRKTLNSASGHKSNDATMHDKSSKVYKYYDEHKDSQSATLVNDHQTEKKGNQKQKKGKKIETRNLLDDGKDAPVKDDKKVNTNVARARNPIESNKYRDKKVEHVASDKSDLTGEAGHAVMTVGKTEEEPCMVLAQENPVLCTKEKKKMKKQQQKMDPVEAVGGTDRSDKNGSPGQTGNSSTLSRRQKKNLKNRKQTLLCCK